jgi:uncharacterized iron-regulated membrane protein
MVHGKTRSLFHKLHLYLGLWCGLVFVLLGLTGSAIAWMHELDSMLNPDLFHGSSTDRTTPVPADRVQNVVDLLSADPLYGRPSQLTLPEHAGDVFVAWYRAPPTASVFKRQISRQVMVDPATLRVLGERNWGEFGLSKRLLMPTLFNLHRYLVAGEAGKTVVGVSGLLMLFLAVAGLVLWCPALRYNALRQALRISYRGSWPRFHFTFHRAAGFFVAPILIVQGFSGWYFNLPAWVVPIVGSVMTVSPGVPLKNQPAAQGAPLSPLSIEQAMRAAQSAYPAARVSRIGLPPTPSAPFEVRVRQPGEVRQGDGATRITIDAYSGKILRARDPLRAPPGDTFLNWQFPLHSGEAFGTAGRAFISCLGVTPLLFAITGLGIWLHRRRKKIRHEQVNRR